MSGAWDAAARVVDEIDELVDWQLGKDPTGYDHNVGQPVCPRCGDDWHGLAVTARMELMRRVGRLDEGYVYGEDRSPVICPASGEEGPLVPFAVWAERTGVSAQDGRRPATLESVRPREVRVEFHFNPLVDELYAALLPSPGHIAFGFLLDQALWDAAREERGER